MQPLQPRFEELPEFRCVGVQYFGDNKAGEIPAMWPQLNAVSNLVNSKIQPPIYVGVETYPPNFHEQRKWYYLAGLVVTDLDQIPMPMVGKIIPANHYAVFTHTGKLPGKIGETFGYIYGQWLPSSGYKQAGPYDFERYDSRFLGPDNDASVMEIWVPVKK